MQRKHVAALHRELVDEPLRQGLASSAFSAVPDDDFDLAVIGFRDGPRGQFLEPRLTSFRMSLHDLGVTVAQTLLSTMPAYAPFYPNQARHCVWPMLLVAGESDPAP